MDTPSGFSGVTLLASTSSSTAPASDWITVSKSCAFSATKMTVISSFAARSNCVAVFVAKHAVYDWHTAKDGGAHSVGAMVGEVVGPLVGEVVGLSEGSMFGELVGPDVGDVVGPIVGASSQYSVTKP